MKEKTQIRIVAGKLRGRRLTCIVTPELRPTPQMVREAFFSILGDAIPERPFVDIFAGTGVVGLEAISRGATHCTFLERDFQLANQIDRYLKEFGVSDRGLVLRADVYRWVERWQPRAEPANVFVSPPFADLQGRLDGFLGMIATIQARVPVGSVVTVQAEVGFPGEQLPGAGWDERAYGRNLLYVWVKMAGE